jgi:Uma2 family endonuclease
MATSKSPDVLPGKLGYEDFWSVPDDGNRYEIIDGKLYVTPAPGMPHQIVSNRLQFFLNRHIEGKRLGHVFSAPTAVILGAHRQVQPDLVFLGKDRLRAVSQKEIQGAPDLAVEILSPTTKKTDRLIKASAYADSGISWYWIVDPDAQTLEEYRLAAGRYELVRRWEESETFEPALFPGLCIALADLFDWSDFEGLAPR